MLTDPSIARGEIAPGPSHLTAREAVSLQKRESDFELTEFVGPILHERRGTRYDSLVDRSLASDWRLLEESPEKRDALQLRDDVNLANLETSRITHSLSQSHLVGHDTPMHILLNHSGDRLVQELDSLDLMRSQNFPNSRIDNDGHFDDRLRSSFRHEPEHLCETTMHLGSLLLRLVQLLLTFDILGRFDPRELELDRQSLRFSIVDRRIPENDGVILERVEERSRMNWNGSSRSQSLMGQLRFDELALELDSRELECAADGGAEGFGTIDRELLGRRRSDVFVDETPFVRLLLPVVRVGVVGSLLGVGGCLLGLLRGVGIVILVVCIIFVESATLGVDDSLSLPRRRPT